MKIPIACTLGSEDAAVRLDEWRAALGSTVVGVSRPAPERAELRLVSEPAAIATLIDLAEREKACCEFFDFAFEVEGDGVKLVVSVPHEATAVLDDFAFLASPSGEDRT
jgi:hypothetical protein